MISVEMFQNVTVVLFVFWLVSMFCLWYYANVTLPYMVYPSMDLQAKNIITEAQRLQDDPENSKMSLFCDAAKAIHTLDNKGRKKLSIVFFERHGVRGVANMIRASQSWASVVKSQESTDVDKFVADVMSFQVKVIKYYSPVAYHIAWFASLFQMKVSLMSEQESHAAQPGAFSLQAAPSILHAMTDTWRKLTPVATS